VLLRAVPVLGQFRVDLSGITLEGLDLSKAKSGLALGADGAFLLSVDQLKANVNARFTYQRTTFPQVISASPPPSPSTLAHAAATCRPSCSLPRLAGMRLEGIHAVFIQSVAWAAWCWRTNQHADKHLNCGHAMPRLAATASRM
jgi:hypothetical protein